MSAAPAIPACLAKYGPEILAGLGACDRRAAEFNYMANGSRREPPPNTCPGYADPSCTRPDLYPERSALSARAATFADRPHPAFDREPRYPRRRYSVKAGPKQKRRPAARAKPARLGANIPVKFSPELAAAATKRQMEVIEKRKIKGKEKNIKSFVSLAPAWRAWAIARAAATTAGTYGDVETVLFYKTAKAAGIHRSSIERGVKQARELGWLRKVQGKKRPDRFIIASQKTIALDLNKAPGRFQVEIDISLLGGKGWRANLTAAWEETANKQARWIVNKKDGLKWQPKVLRPMSRRKQQELIGVDRYKMARYDRQAGVISVRNWQITDRPIEDIPMALEHGQPAVAIDNRLAIRKPDARTFDGVIRVSRFGQRRSILQALNKRGASHNPELFFDVALSTREEPGKIFCEDEKEAKRLTKKLASNRDVFFRAGRSHKGSVLWRAA